MLECPVPTPLFNPAQLRRGADRVTHRTLVRWGLMVCAFALGTAPVDAQLVGTTPRTADVDYAASAGLSLLPRPFRISSVMVWA